MSKTSRHYYTADDLRDAVEDEQAKFIVWRHQVLRELRACLGRIRPAAKTEQHDDGNNETLKRSGEKHR